MDPPAEKWLKEWRLFSLDKRRLRAELKALYNYLKRGYRRVSIGLLTQVTRKKMEGNYLELHRGGKLGIRKYFFTGKVFKCWTRLSREVAKVASLDIFKKHVDVTLRDLTVLCV